MRSEKGSITLFVLVTSMFVLITLLLTSMNIMDKKESQEKQLLKIQKSYTVTESDLEKEYVSAK